MPYYSQQQLLDISRSDLMGFKPQDHKNDSGSLVGQTREFVVFLKQQANAYQANGDAFAKLNQSIQALPSGFKTVGPWLLILLNDKKLALKLEEITTQLNSWLAEERRPLRDAALRLIKSFYLMLEIVRNDLEIDNVNEAKVIIPFIISIEPQKKLILNAAINRLQVVAAEFLDATLLTHARYRSLQSSDGGRYLQERPGLDQNTHAIIKLMTAYYQIDYRLASTKKRVNNDDDERKVLEESAVSSQVSSESAYMQYCIPTELSGSDEAVVTTTLQSTEQNVKTMLQRLLPEDGVSFLQQAMVIYFLQRIATLEPENQTQRPDLVAEAYFTMRRPVADFQKLF